MGGGLNRLAFALKYNTIEILLSGYLKQESRILYERQIDQRLEKIMPFLRYDADYYPVLGESGKLWGMKDAYTFSNKYPYAKPYSDDLNYIRNSVKVVFDPYNGTVDFYEFDKEDPILQALKKMFPGLIKPKEEMPDGLINHLRYPEDLLLIQGRMYSTYHMTDPKSFYGKEDVWQIAKELYGPQPQEIIPYYITMKLPGEKTEEFIQMLPFSPKDVEGRRSNLVGWLAGRSDGQNYGKVLAYKFSKQHLVYGPMQFEAMVSENKDIATQLGIWNQQHDAEVIRGNTLVIPISDVILYVKPIYLKAKQSSMPEVKKVVVGVGEKVEWGDTLNEALSKIIGTVKTVPTKEAPASVQIDEGVKNNIQAAQQELERVNAALKSLQDSLKTLTESFLGGKK